MCWQAGWLNIKSMAVLHLCGRPGTNLASVAVRVVDHLEAISTYITTKHDPLRVCRESCDWPLLVSIAWMFSLGRTKTCIEACEAGTLIHSSRGNGEPDGTRMRMWNGCASTGASSWAIHMRTEEGRPR